MIGGWAFGFVRGYSAALTGFREADLWGTGMVEHYLDEEDRRLAIVREAISSLGSLSDEEAAALRGSMRRLRSTWRSS